jgi:hypothetical protein
MERDDTPTAADAHEDAVRTTPTRRSARHAITPRAGLRVDRQREREAFLAFRGALLGSSRPDRIVSQPDRDDSLAGHADGAGRSRASAGGSIHERGFFTYEISIRSNRESKRAAHV